MWSARIMASWSRNYEAHLENRIRIGRMGKCESLADRLPIPCTGIIFRHRKFAVDLYIYLQLSACSLLAILCINRRSNYLEKLNLLEITIVSFCSAVKSNISRSPKTGWGLVLSSKYLLSWDKWQPGRYKRWPSSKRTCHFADPPTLRMSQKKAVVLLYAI